MLLVDDNGTPAKTESAGLEPPCLAVPSLEALATKPSCYKHPQCPIYSAIFSLLLGSAGLAPCFVSLLVFLRPHLPLLNHIHSSSPDSS
jgi:hypothetical protein